MVSEQVQTNRIDFGGNGNPLAPKSTMDIATTRAAQEVQAAMAIAKRFPRDETAAFGRIIKACKRKTLAEAALYAYPKGGQTVTGPSIRMAEALAQNWGNIDFGIVELEQKKGESSVMAYAWDLETNTRQTKIFTVPHLRFTKKGSYDLDDPREIYELTANQGARRLRACILGVIPGDVVDAAVAECEKTMSGNNTEPLSDRIRAMVSAFGEFSVTQEMLEKRLGHNVDVTTETELTNLKKVYRSLKDNMADRADFFEVGGAAPSSEANDLNAKAAAAQAKKPTMTQEEAADLIEKQGADAKAKRDAQSQQKSNPAKDSQVDSDADAAAKESYDKWITGVNELAESEGRSALVYAGMEKKLKKIGITNTPWKMSEGDRRDTLDAIKKHEGYFAG